MMQAFILYLILIAINKGCGTDFTFLLYFQVVRCKQLMHRLAWLIDNG